MKFKQIFMCWTFGDKIRPHIRKLCKSNFESVKPNLENGKWCLLMQWVYSNSFEVFRKFNFMSEPFYVDLFARF